MIKYTKIQTLFFRDPKNNNKTLMEGVFTLPEFEYLQNNEWIFTEKVDGTNIRILWEGDGIQFGGKSDNAQIHAKLVDALRAQFDGKEDEFFEAFKQGLEEGETPQVCLYGEGYGAGVQKCGGNYRQDQGFVLFDVKVGPWWLQRTDVEDIASKLGLDIVPIIGSGTLWDMVGRCKDGITSLWGNFPAEGIVARPATELCQRNGKRIITKLKSKDYK